MRSVVLVGLDEADARLAGNQDDSTAKAAGGDDKQEARTISVVQPHKLACENEESKTAAQNPDMSDARIPRLGSRARKRSLSAFR